MRQGLYIHTGLASNLPFSYLSLVSVKMISIVYMTVIKLLSWGRGSEIESTFHASVEPEIETQKPIYNPNTVAAASAIPSLFWVDGSLRQETPWKFPCLLAFISKGKPRYSLSNKVERMDQHMRLSWAPNTCRAHVLPHLWS